MTVFVLAMLLSAVEITRPTALVSEAPETPDAGVTYITERPEAGTVYAEIVKEEAPVVEAPIDDKNTLVVTSEVKPMAITAATALVSKTPANPIKGTLSVVTDAKQLAGQTFKVGLDRDGKLLPFSVDVEIGFISTINDDGTLTVKFQDAEPLPEAKP